MIEFIDLRIPVIRPPPDPVVSSGSIPEYLSDPPGHQRQLMVALTDGKEISSSMHEVGLRDSVPLNRSISPAVRLVRCSSAAAAWSDSSISHTVTPPQHVGRRYTSCSPPCLRTPLLACMGSGN